MGTKSRQGAYGRTTLGISEAVEERLMGTSDLGVETIVFMSRRNVSHAGLRSSRCEASCSLSSRKPDGDADLIT